MGYPWVEGRDDNPWDVEANAPLLEYGQPAPRPANIVNVDEVEHESGGGDRHGASRDARALQRAGLHWERIAGVNEAPIPHCHSAEEEIFVILDGTATLELWPRGGGPVEETPLRAGHVVARPPGTGVSHSFRPGRTA